jgi:hypothetical protein
MKIDNFLCLPTLITLSSVKWHQCNVSSLPLVIHEILRKYSVLGIIQNCAVHFQLRRELSIFLKQKVRCHFCDAKNVSVSTKVSQPCSFIWQQCLSSVPLVILEILQKESVLIILDHASCMSRELHV